MTLVRIRLPQLVLLGWTMASLALSLMPAGVGGTLRAVNAVVFMAFGPGCAVMVRLWGLLSTSVSSVIAIAVSLTVLILSSQLLLILGAWSAPAVAALVALVTVAVTLAPFLTRLGVRD